MTALEPDFLSVDPVDPPMLRDRDRDQDAEDALCQRLLLLGAKWFDSEPRRDFISALMDDDDDDFMAVRAGEEPPPTRLIGARRAGVQGPPSSTWTCTGFRKDWVPRMRRRSG